MTADVAEAEGMVEQMIDEEYRPLAEVEAAIAKLGLGPEETDALALYAWAWEKTTRRRQLAHELQIEGLLVGG